MGPRWVTKICPLVPKLACLLVPTLGWLTHWLLAGSPAYSSAGSPARFPPSSPSGLPIGFAIGSSIASLNGSPLWLPPSPPAGSPIGSSIGSPIGPNLIQSNATKPRSNLSDSIESNQIDSNRIQSNPPSPINIDQSRQNPSNPPDSNRAPSLEVLPSAVGASCWDHVFVLDCVAMEWLGRYKASLETIQATVHTSITLWHNALVKMSSS